MINQYEEQTILALMGQEHVNLPAAIYEFLQL